MESRNKRCNRNPCCDKCRQKNADCVCQLSLHLKSNWTWSIRKPNGADWSWARSGCVGLSLLGVTLPRFISIDPDQVRCSGCEENLDKRDNSIQWAELSAWSWVRDLVMRRCLLASSSQWFGARFSDVDSRWTSPSHEFFYPDLGARFSFHWFQATPGPFSRQCHL